LLRGVTAAGKCFQTIGAAARLLEKSTYRLLNDSVGTGIMSVGEFLLRSSGPGRKPERNVFCWLPGDAAHDVSKESE
jgi:hypothetical protein